ncbi:hypothetical protein CO172_01490 [Candidatus Uhrbacteria bacterium CG_4_9_14_3_um_filter_36_7]|uniref:Uncharacterized protein n=1 Tax=Candidatus Uhrbacteria bacterium CG_4_9_14_3_um_filter_36_7 TaxID=1975033 RepID=A0A2M7XHU2_9BACT|nr:MAG: hypothetical protein CO172_01490 [Candidatus Uhrbacteria bacterium CG_4_9_14_3_um_filter_36_7]
MFLCQWIQKTQKKVWKNGKVDTRNVWTWILPVIVIVDWLISYALMAGVVYGLWWGYGMNLPPETDEGGCLVAIEKLNQAVGSFHAAEIIDGVILEDKDVKEDVNLPLNQKQPEFNPTVFVIKRLVKIHASFYHDHA